jgi:uncharacterized protein
MKIQERISLDLAIAMREKDEPKKSLLRVVIGEFNRVDKQLSDEQATAVLKKMYQNAIDLKNTSEQSILEEYIPQQLTEEGLKAIIKHLIEDNSYTMKDMGKIMGQLKTDFPGRYDGKLASQLIKGFFA